MRFPLALVILLTAPPVAAAANLAPNTAVRDSCVEGGGKYERVGTVGNWTCVMPYPDGGHKCSDDHQCLGGCVVDYSERHGPVL